MADSNPNSREDVNADVRSAIAELKGEEPEAVIEPEVAEVAEPEAPAEAEVAPPAKKREHGPDGKFIAKGGAEKEPAPAKAAAPKTEITPPVDDKAKVSAQPSTAATPPVSWAADAKQTWASLPPAVQAAVLKREREFSDGIVQKSEQVRQYEQAIAPIAQEAQRLGLNVNEGIQRLMDGHRFLSEQPAQAILWLAQKHNLDLNELATNPPAFQQQARTDSIPPQVLNTISSLEERINSMVVDQNMTVVEQFAQANPHYADVEAEIPAIMRELNVSNPALKGQPLLQAAYDRAIWLNPEVRDKMWAEKQQQTAQTRTAQVQQKAQQASRAAVSVRGSGPAATPPPKPQVNGNDVYADVKASIEQLRAQ